MAPSVAPTKGAADDADVDAPVGGGDITRLLRRWRDGDLAALDELLPTIEDDLARIARSRMRELRRRLHDRGGGRTIDTGGLVNEAWIALARQRSEWKNREQFFAIAARKMRQICCDHARRATALKRTPPAAEAERADPSPTDALQLLELDRALARLETVDPRLVRVVELKFFAGLEDKEIAEALGISERTVRREWALAKAWLHRELVGKHP